LPYFIVNGAPVKNENSSGEYFACYFAGTTDPLSIWALRQQYTRKPGRGVHACSACKISQYRPNK